jgi:hypothetical protein
MFAWQNLDKDTAVNLALMTIHLAKGFPHVFWEEEDLFQAR